ncbi:hypothetical protein QWY93_00370 [Echinicola jeungdonensis]|uniref:Phosphate-selective porin O and P n=1 Tax=Echinicola jeungdonensis TaxID=709343 RepID=A0ABV5J0K5_9BACT|nr:hypothetical protein [Echinicola jeungdonensis]MDN3667795.1 hypothetical protein [Echinicola jeungdonensis]
MKNLVKGFNVVLLSVGALFAGISFAQAQGELQYHRSNDKTGLAVFESPKTAEEPFDGIKVKVGGDFAIQFQGLDQSNDQGNLVELGSNFNLPTANLNLDVQLQEGVKLHMRTYLSSKHHTEAWVKGGHLQIDKLDFVSPGFLGGLMEYTTILIGLDEVNYGDAHFRRTDNGRAIYNPFVGNYIMDSFTTEAFGEVRVQKSGFLGVLGITNGKLNQSVAVNDNTDNKISFFGKLGYDDEVAEDLRLRLTGSWYINNGTSTGTYLYGGDRAGSRYYKVMETLDGDGSDFEGRFNPRFRQLTAIQINPFVQFKGLEFFGIYEVASDSDEQGGGSFTQLGGELLYRFGGDEQFYLGGRYNQVKGEMTSDANSMDINRVNFGGGWYMTKNIVTKIEYVNQKYEGFDAESKYSGGEFNGINIEAAISF